MSLKSDKAVNTFNSGCNCSQAVFTSFCEDFGITKDLGLKISTGLGAGVASNGEICGAVSGAIMALGLKFGVSKEDTYKVINNYIDRFKSINGSINCTDLVGFNLSSNSEYIKAKESGVFELICSRLVKDSVEIVEDYINITEIYNIHMV